MQKEVQPPTDLPSAQSQFWTLQAKLERARKPETRQRLARDLEVARGHYHQFLDLQKAIREKKYEKVTL